MQLDKSKTRSGKFGKICKNFQRFLKTDQLFESSVFCSVAIFENNISKTVLHTRVAIQMKNKIEYKQFKITRQRAFKCPALESELKKKKIGTPCYTYMRTQFGCLLRLP